jgi:hypothetical protein
MYLMADPQTSTLYACVMSLAYWCNPHKDQILSVWVILAHIYIFLFYFIFVLCELYVYFVRDSGSFNLPCDKRDLFLK